MSAERIRIKHAAAALTAAVFAFLCLCFPMNAAAQGTEGKAGENISWTLDGGCLTITGSGPMPDYTWNCDAPWLACADSITSVTIGEGIGSVGDYAFINCFELRSCSLPESLRSIGIQAYANCISLSSIVVPAGVGTVGDYAFSGCTSLRSVSFLGPPPVTGPHCFKNVTAAAYGSCVQPGWTSVAMQQYGGQLTWESHAFDDGNIVKKASAGEDGVVKYTCTVCGAEIFESIPASAAAPAAKVQEEPCVCFDMLAPGSIININGRNYCLDSDRRVYPAESSDCFAVQYSYDFEASNGSNIRSPEGMRVWLITRRENGFTLCELPALKDLFGYTGTCIRTRGERGMRAVFSVSPAIGSLPDVTVLEYGILAAFQTDPDEDLTFGSSGVSQVPVYTGTGSCPLSFFCEAAGLSEKDCARSLTARPYARLRTPSGSEAVLYGAAVSRTAGYAAWQNRAAFPSGSQPYSFIWDMIHAAYGNRYDDEFVP